MNLQTSYDLRLAERRSGNKVKKEIQPVQQEHVA
jgi:plasmid maintenance system antidote protein VapI